MTTLRTLIDRAIASQLDDRLGDALELYSEALNQKPNMPAIRQLFGRLIEYHVHLAATLQDMGRHHEAIRILQRVLPTQPAIAPVHSMLGKSYVATGNAPDATRHLQRYLELDPADAAGAALLLAHIGAGSTPPMPTANFVREFYAGYAETYDEQLTQDLAYRCPELIRNALTQRGQRNLRILDIGCGTGLCGIAVKPLASRLEGVDLSTPMLAKARDLGVYDRLEEADVIEFLRQCTNDYDTVIAGGLLEHIGDPAPFFDAALHALAPGGVLAVTAVDNRGERVQVNGSSFYTHNETVFRAAAETTGLSVESLEPAVLRRESNEDVHGLVAILVRPERCDSD